MEIGIFCPAGWSSLVAREAHNLEVVGSNPAPATFESRWIWSDGFFYAHLLIFFETFWHWVSVAF